MSLMYGGDGESPAEHYEYEGFYPGSACHQIMLADPQGGEIEPTEEVNGRAQAVGDQHLRH